MAPDRVVAPARTRTGAGRSRDAGPKIWGWIASGFEPPPEPPTPVYCVGPHCSHGELKALGRPGTDGTGGLALFCPSYVSRCDEAVHIDHLRHLLPEISSLREVVPELPLWLIVGMQWAKAEESEARHRLAAMAELAAAHADLRFLGISLPGPGKVRSVNAALRVGRALAPRGWLWIDDDVRLEPGCLAHLTRRFVRNGFRGAVGATKVISARPQPASRALRAVKAYTRPPHPYPNACCMIVEADVLRNGIRSRYHNDDGFVFFSLVDPKSDDPYRLLHVLPEARCRVSVGGPLRETLLNLRRNLFSHLVLMADATPEVRRLYARDCLFHGLWPVAPWDSRQKLRAALTKWAVKSLYLLWFCQAAGLLAIRGLARRPMRKLAWGAYSDYPVAEPTDVAAL